MSTPKHPSGSNTRKVYVVEFESVAIGLAMLGSVNPVVGDHLYKLPPLAASCKGWPITIEVSFPALAVTFGITRTRMVSNDGLGQPFVS